MPTLIEIVERVQEHLRDNPCRGIVLGLGENGAQMQISWIMGRSENSQNRVYTAENGVLKTEAADPSKVKDPSLIIYNVMRSVDDFHIVSNGDQTDTAVQALSPIPLTSFSLRTSPEDLFFGAMRTRYCEPDAPNFTPRITGYQDSRQTDVVSLSVLKSDHFAKARWIETEARIKAGDTTRVHKDSKSEFPTLGDEFTRTLEPGFGYMLTTYMPGSKELPSFQGEPLLVPIRGSLENVMRYFWGALDSTFRVSVGGKEITPAGFRYAAPINRFEKKA